MTDIQSANSVSPIKSHFLLGGSVQLRRQLPRPSAYCFNAIFWLLYLLEYKLSSFSRHQKRNFPVSKSYILGIYPVLVKGVFPGSFLLCLTTVHNKL